MAESASRELLTAGMFLIVLVISIMLVALGVMDWFLVPALVLALCGCWFIVLSGIRSSNPQKYERSPFSTFALGLFLVAVGGAWLLASVNWLYSMAIILLVLGALAIVAALRRK